MTVRDCVFLVADTNMHALIAGFLTRDRFWESLRCGEFEFDEGLDIVRSPGADPAVFHTAHELLRSYTATHRHCVVLLDTEFSGSPGAEILDTTITSNLVRAGWCREDVLTITIEPELEAWLWVRSPHLARILGFSNWSRLREWLTAEDDATWHSAAPKPHRPKEALERVLDRTRTPRTSALYRVFSGRTSPRSCQDRQFLRLVETLQRWFPHPATPGE